MKNTGLSRGESLEMGVDDWSGEFGTPRFQAIYRFLLTTCGGTREEETKGGGVKGGKGGREGWKGERVEG